MSDEPKPLTETPKELNVMMWIWGAFFTINALCSAALAALIGKSWVPDKVLVTIAIVQGWTTTMGAFLSKSVARARQGKPIVDDDGTTPPIKP